MKIFSGLVTTFLLSLAVLHVGAADWPQWGGRNARNFVSHKTKLPTFFNPARDVVTDAITTPVPGVNLKWTAPLGTLSYVTPALSHGRIFTWANNARVDSSRFANTKGSVLDCLDAATGKRLWRLAIPHLRTLNKLFCYDDLNPGLCSAPDRWRLTESSTSPRNANFTLLNYMNKIRGIIGERTRKL